MKRKSYLILALVVAVALSSGYFAYTYSTASGTIGATGVEGDIVTVEPAAGQPDWNVIMADCIAYWESGGVEGQLSGEVPLGDLFVVTPHSDYTGDLLVKVCLTNTGALNKAYQYLNMELTLTGAVDGVQLFTLDNGVATFNLAGGASGSHYLQLTGGSYSLRLVHPEQWEDGWSITPELYCKATQR